MRSFSFFLHVLCTLALAFSTWFPLTGMISLVFSICLNLTLSSVLIINPAYPHIGTGPSSSERSSPLTSAFPKHFFYSTNVMIESFFS